MPTVSSQSDYLRQSVRTTSRKQDGTDFGKRLSRRFRPWPKIGHLQSEWAVTFGRNDRSRSIGISGHIGPEYATAEVAGNPAVLGEIARHGLTWDQANAQAGDLLSGHELGHAVIDAYGIVLGSLWLNEFLASYVWYAYISEQRPEKLWLFDVIQAGNQLERPQRFVTLAELDLNYKAIVASDMKTNNYGWYQGQLIERVRQTYRV